MKFITTLFVIFAPIAAVQAAELTELSCSDFRPTEEAVERYQDLKGACEGIAEVDGELYAKFAAIVRRVPTGGRSIRLYLPATEHSFTVNPDPQSLVWVGDKKVRVVDLTRGQEIRIYLKVDEIASPDIDEIVFITEDDLLVEHSAERGVTVQKPARVITTVVKTEAIVESFDPQTRELKLIDAESNRLTIVVDERVGALDNLQASDRIVIEYLESVAIVVAPEGSELPIGDAGVLAASNDEERPALVSAETSVVVATVEAFNAEDRWATLRMEDGTLQSIMVSEDARLDLVKVGDQVRFRVTRAMAISVEEPDS